MLRHIQRLVAGAMQPGLTSASSSSACSTSGTAAFGALHLRLLASPAAASSDTTTTSTSGSPEAPVASTSGFRRVQAQSLEHSHGFLQGIVHINNTLNNIIVALTDEAGNLKALVSAGQVGFRNARKSQPAAAEKAADELAKKALALGFGTVVVKMKGAGSNKQVAVQSLHAAGLRIKTLMDVTPIPYNGCRQPKRRRV